MDVNKNSDSKIVEWLHRSWLGSLFGEATTWSTQNILVFFLLVIAFVKLVQNVSKNKTLPPGPTGLPVVGVLPFLRHKPYITIQRWWERYGDVFSVYMGQR